MKSVAVVGATGAVGVEVIRCLEQRKFPISDLRLLASPRSKGKRLAYKGESLQVEELENDSFKGIDIAFFTASGDVSRRFAPIAVQSGAIVVDNSSAFRLADDVPLVIPEINSKRALLHNGIIANPNCSTIIAITPLWPLHRKAKIRRLWISTYQAASGAGAAAMEELVNSTRAYLDGTPFENKVLPHPYAFNLFSHNSKIDVATGYNEEELKVVRETQKIFEDREIRVSPTCVRVPVLRAHTESLTFELERPLSLEEVRSLVANAPGVKLVDDRERNYFPMPIDASGQDMILAGRIRADIADPSGHSYCMLVAGDQLLKGAAQNAVQIAELLL